MCGWCVTLLVGLVAVPGVCGGMLRVSDPQLLEVALGEETHIIIEAHLTIGDTLREPGETRGLWVITPTESVTGNCSLPPPAASTGDTPVELTAGQCVLTLQDTSISVAAYQPDQEVGFLFSRLFISLVSGQPGTHGQRLFAFELWDAAVAYLEYVTVFGNPSPDTNATEMSTGAVQLRDQARAHMQDCYVLHLQPGHVADVGDNSTLSIYGNMYAFVGAVRPDGGGGGGEDLESALAAIVLSGYTAAVRVRATDFIDVDATWNVANYYQGDQRAYVDAGVLVSDSVATFPADAAPDGLFASHEDVAVEEIKQDLMMELGTGGPHTGPPDDRAAPRQNKLLAIVLGTCACAILGLVVTICCCRLQPHPQADRRPRTSRYVKAHGDELGDGVFVAASGL